MSRKSILGGKKKKKAPKETARESVYFDEELEPVEVEMIPEDQLELTKAELDEEFTQTLTSLDPNQPHKLTYFNFKKGAFESKPNNQHIAEHINHDGIIWSKKEREELEKIGKDKEKEEEPQNEEKDEKEQNEDEDEDKENENENEESQQETENADDDNKEETDKDETKENDDDEKEEHQEETEKKNEVLVKNQFNFSDRASQTFNEPLRDREVQTEPAPKSVFSQNANPSSIRDEYLKNLLKLKQQQIEEENKKKKSGFSSTSANNTNRNESNEDDSIDRIKHHDESDALLHSKAMFKALKIMERVAVLNANSESYHEFRYYKDSDYKRGSFLTHLWRFKYNENGNKMVTCLEWNKSHLDLFGVGYGSYDFNQQTNGMICIYSLKSTAFPEKIIMCESGVMCMSFHPKYSSLICVGSYDGSVAVYDIRNRDDSPIYSSENPETHHSDPVTDIKWYFDELQHDLVFYSISSDSEIKIWKMSQNELNHESFIKLTTPPIKTETDERNEDEDTDDDEDWGDIPALCSCIDFNPFMEHLYLVGTEDGHIMECNKTHTDGYTKIYKNAHFMNVYGVKWNPFHSKIFLSCSEDWTIKLWEMETDKSDKERENMEYEPIITYDLGCSVNDVVWSPFSSTIFCAVTNDGKVHIFDLSQNKNTPICTQQITKKSKNIKLTKASFPVGFPLVLVGDEKGNIFALKLSPNLYLNKAKHRDILKNVSPTMFDNQDFKEKEKEKLINVLNVTGNKVFDVIQHFSPKPKKFRSPIKK